MDFALEGFDEFGERLGAEVAFAAMADGDSASLGFLGANDRACREFSGAARRGFLRAAFRCGRRDGREDCGASGFR